MSSSARSFLEARDFLLAHRTDYDTARRDFRWPRLDRFNWALDYFDAMARGNDRPRCGSSTKTAASRRCPSPSCRGARARSPTSCVR